MWDWLAENYITLIALTAVGLLIAGAVILLLRQRKKGSCGGGCASCPYCSACHGKKE